MKKRVPTFIVNTAIILTLSCMPCYGAKLYYGEASVGEPGYARLSGDDGHIICHKGEKCEGASAPLRRMRPVLALKSPQVRAEERVVAVASPVESAGGAAPVKQAAVKVDKDCRYVGAVYFPLNSYVLGQSQRTQIDRFVPAGVKKVSLRGYTCDLGTDARNRYLAEMRVKSVEDYLKSKGVEVVGREYHPRSGYLDGKQRAFNRRVEIETAE